MANQRLVACVRRGKYRLRFSVTIQLKSVNCSTATRCVTL
jgi:hypothetical protein